MSWTISLMASLKATFNWGCRVYGSAARHCCRYGRDVCLDNKPLHVQASHSCTQLQCESLRWTFFFLISVFQNLFVTSFDKKWSQFLQQLCVASKSRRLTSSLVVALLCWVFVLPLLSLCALRECVTLKGWQQLRVHMWSGPIVFLGCCCSFIHSAFCSGLRALVKGRLGEKRKHRQPVFPVTKYIANPATPHASHQGKQWKGE